MKLPMILLWKAVVFEVGVQRLQAQPQKYWFAENLEKSHENSDKNSFQRCLTSKNGAQRLHKNTWRPFLEVTLNRGLHDLCRRNFVGKSCTKNFTGKFGEIRAKSFGPQKFAWSCTYDEKTPLPRCPSFERAEVKMPSTFLHSPASLCILF